MDVRAAGLARGLGWERRAGERVAYIIVVSTGIDVVQLKRRVRERHHARRATHGAAARGGQRAADALDPHASGVSRCI